MGRWGIRTNPGPATEPAGKPRAGRVARSPGRGPHQVERRFHRLHGRLRGHRRRQAGLPAAPRASLPLSRASACHDVTARDARRRQSPSSHDVAARPRPSPLIGGVASPAAPSPIGPAIADVTPTEPQQAASGPPALSPRALLGETSRRKAAFRTGFDRLFQRPSRLPKPGRPQLPGTPAPRRPLGVVVPRGPLGVALLPHPEAAGGRGSERAPE